MIENFNFEKTRDLIIKWSDNNVWTYTTLYQGLLIIASFIIGAVLHRLLRKRINATIENAKIPTAARRIFQNLAKLLLPILTLIILFIGIQIFGVESMHMKTGIAQGVFKVLLAWVAIRTAVQFIANNAIRNYFAFTIWTIAALSIFGLLDHTMVALDAFAFSIGDFRLSALAVIKSILMIIALMYFAIFASGFAEKKIFEVRSFTRSSQVLLAKVIRITLIVFALLIGVTSAGIDLSLFAVFGGAIGLGIGFGLQKVISNLFSGMLLLLDRSIKPGDVIEIPDIGTFGWVNNMSARYTEIVTRDNKSFLIPNEDFITQRVINWSHGNSLVRIHLSFGVHYNSNPHKVMEVAIEAAKTPARVVDTPAPVCWITELADSSVNFDLRFWIRDAAEGVANVRGEVFLALWDAFKENGIEIPYPHREVFVHQKTD